MRAGAYSCIKKEARFGKLAKRMKINVIGSMRRGRTLDMVVLIDKRGGTGIRRMSTTGVARIQSTQHQAV